MNISAPHLANLLDFATTLNIDIQRVKKKFLKNSEMDLSMIQNSISEQEMSEIIKELVVLSGDKHFGLHYGCFMNLKAMGLIFNISQTATSVEQVIFILKEFLQSTFPVFKLFINDSEDEVSLELKCDVDDDEVKKHLTDASLCIMYRELKLIVDASCKIKPGFPWSELDEYNKLLGNEVRFKNTHVISFNKEYINRNLHQKSVAAIGELLPAYLMLIETSKSNLNFSDQVRKMILNMCSPALPELDQVAAQFCMSTRSFQRKLNKEGESFRSIADQVKHKISSCLKKGGQLRTKEIAYILGYSESSAYLHAAKKWELRNC